MRITSFIIFNQLTRSLSRTLQQYYAQNDTLTTGKKINAPSDNPEGLMRSMDYRVSVNAGEQYMRNIDLAANNLDFAGTVLASAFNTLSNIQKLAAKNRSAQEPQERVNDANQAAMLRDMLHDIANSKIMNQYIFGGFKSETPPYDGAYGYQGDNGEVNMPVSASGAMVPVNISGNYAFSYTLAAPTVEQISGGRFAHYTPGAGTEVQVEIRDTDDTTVLDTFSFSNVIQMTDLLSSAITADDTARVEALNVPFDRMQEQLMTVQTDLGGRLNNLKDHSTIIGQNTETLNKAIASIEEADPVETIAKLRQTEITLQALRDSASRVLSQSLFDFLR